MEESLLSVSDVNKQKFGYGGISVGDIPSYRSPPLLTVTTTKKGGTQTLQHKISLSLSPASFRLLRRTKNETGILSPPPPPTP